MRRYGGPGGRGGGGKALWRDTRSRALRFAHVPPKCRARHRTRENCGWTKPTPLTIPVRSSKQGQGTAGPHAAPASYAAWTLPNHCCSSFKFFPLPYTLHSISLSGRTLQSGVMHLVYLIDRVGSGHAPEGRSEPCATSKKGEVPKLGTLFS